MEVMQIKPRYVYGSLSYRVAILRYDFKQRNNFQPDAFPGRYVWFDVMLIDIINKLGTVVSSVSKDTAPFYIYVSQNWDCKIYIITLALAGHYVNWISISVHCSMYFCIWPAAAMAYFIERTVFSSSCAVLVGLHDGRIQGNLI